MFSFNRRSALVAGVLSAAALALAACTGGGSAGGAAAGEMVMGEADAPVTVVEYASVTCPHCAAWTTSVFPEFKARYIDTGQVRFVFRELPTPPAPVAIAGFLTARCAAERGGDERYFTMLDAMMRNQQAFIANPRQYLLDMARSSGMSEAEFDACVTDEAALNAMNDRIRDASAQGVTGTPYFLINGEQHEDITLEGFEAALRPLIGGAAPAPASPAASAPPEVQAAADSADASAASTTPTSSAPAAVPAEG